MIEWNRGMTEKQEWKIAELLLEEVLVKIETHVELVPLAEKIEEFLRPAHEQR